MKTGITGATGHFGRLAVQKLKQQIKPSDLVALVRAPEKAADMGIETRLFDYDKPDTLEKGLRGIDHLLLISASEVGKREKQHRNIIEAAQKAGVKWIVYTSLLRADTTSLDLGAEHLVTENLLKSSGISYTILRNGWYTENYTVSVPGAVKAGALIGSAADGKISGAAREDYVDAAVAVLTGSHQQGKIYELAGDGFFTLHDLAAEVSKQTGKAIPYKNLSETEYASALTSFGVPEAFAKHVASWDISASKGDLFDDSHTLSKLTGKPTKPLSEIVKKALA